MYYGLLEGHRLEEGVLSITQFARVASTPAMPSLD